MAFFNKIRIKYNEKTYASNTADFKSRLIELYTKASEIPGAANAGIGRTLSRLANLSQKYSYQKKFEPAKIKAIDDRISHLLDLIEKDIRDENIPSISCHSEILFSAFKDSRQYGEEKHDKNYLEHWEIKAFAMGEMLKTLQEKEELQKAIKNIQARAREARDMGDEVGLQKINLEYREKIADREQCEEAFADFERKYDAAAAIMGEASFGERLDVLEYNAVMSPQAFERMVCENTERLNKIIERETEIADTEYEATTERNKLRATGKKSNVNVLDDINAEDVAEGINQAKGMGDQASGSQKNKYDDGLFGDEMENKK